MNYDRLTKCINIFLNVVIIPVVLPIVLTLALTHLLFNYPKWTKVTWTHKTGWVME